VTNDWNPRRKQVVIGTLAGGAGIVLVIWLFGWGGPPPLQGDREAAKTVDALFTAVTARDLNLLLQCQQRLRAQREAGNLGAAALAYLEDIIGEARGDHWDSAAERLFEFMRAQRLTGLRASTKKGN
jgi:hypothetical protein